MKKLEPLPRDRVTLYTGYRARIKRMIRSEVSRYLIEVETAHAPSLYVYVGIRSRWHMWTQQCTIIQPREHHDYKARTEASA